MKKHLIVIALAILAFSCKKKDETALTPITPALCHNIPYWPVDSLYSSKGGVIKYDTFVTYKSGDTTLLKYKNQKLYVFCKDNANYKYNDSLGAFISCYISPNYFDTTGAWTKCDITNPHYWSATYNAWKEAAFSIQIKTMYPHFDTTANSIYIGY